MSGTKISMQGLKNFLKPTKFLEPNPCRSKLQGSRCLSCSISEIPPRCTRHDNHLQIILFVNLHEAIPKQTAKMATILLPGEEISPQDLPTKSKKGTLTLGPGLRHILSPTSTSILATTAGSLHVDNKKSALWLERPHGRYRPSVGDLVIAQIHHGSAETWHCTLSPHTPFALLGNLAFEGANKKNRPNLQRGDIVYARVSRASKFEDTEIECFNSATGKGEGMGQLKGGMLFNISPAFVRRLMMGKSKGGIVVLEEVGEKVKFEIAVGRNGKVWIDSGIAKITIAIGRLLQQTEEGSWDVEQQKKAVRKVLKDV